MPKIEWDETFSVNNEEIDSQHKKWIDMLNVLHDSLLKGDLKEINYTTVRTIESMKEYIREHFTYEENYMKKMHYPELAAHTNIHSKLYVQVSEYYNDVKSGKIVLNRDIMSILTNWLRDHILNEDKKYSSFAAGQE